MGGEKEALKKVEAEVRGRTFIVYLYFIRRGHAPVGVREVQRDLGLSSPSVAWHHLEKLRELGLLRKNIEGEYSLAKRVPVGALRLLVRVGRFMLPRFLFYAVLFTVMLSSYLAIFKRHDLVALMFGAIACFILWYETIKILRETSL
jgi:DNA-binding transcriptional ArsR family regulator